MAFAGKDHISRPEWSRKASVRMNARHVVHMCRYRVPIHTDAPPHLGFQPFRCSHGLTRYSRSRLDCRWQGDRGSNPGLVEEQETPDVSALRELKECTGFTGSIKKIGPVLAMDPGASNCAMRLVTVEVNGDDYDNINMTSFIDSQRFKEPILIPVSELLEKLSAFASAGFIIDSRIDAFAIGLVMGNNSRKNKIPTTLIM
uniref:Uncharacterized protein n=1 Tax=Timema douglasi TaxID=61478 RepID=A0A7R8VR96_TIMDO|nr:unnamed protein product [Timema douglasi]